MGVRLTNAQVVEVREKFAGGARQVDLASEYGVSQNTVSSLVTGRSRRHTGGPITRSSARKLAPRDVILIRVDLAAGRPAADVARRYGITQQMVSQISTGRAYADVGGPLTKPSTQPAKPLTVAQVAEIKRRVAEGERRRQVAAAFGISHWTVDSVMSGRILGRAADGVRKFAREDVKCIRILYQQGVSQVELARTFRTDQQGISQIVRGLTYKSYGGPIAGRPSRRLSFNEVKKIREAFAAGAGLEELADRHDVASPIIRHVVTGATYSDVPGPTFEINRSGDVVRVFIHATLEDSNGDGGDTIGPASAT